MGAAHRDTTATCQGQGGSERHLVRGTLSEAIRIKYQQQLGLEAWEKQNIGDSTWSVYVVKKRADKIY